MRRILVVAPTPTWPLDHGNRRRIHRVCRSLEERGYNIHYMHYASEGDWRRRIRPEVCMKMREQWEHVIEVYPSRELHTYAEGEDHSIDEWWDPAIEPALKAQFEAFSYDAVIVNYAWLSKALEFVPANVFKVLDTHDKFSGRRELLATNGVQPEYFHTTENEEAIALNRAQLVWAIKGEELELFQTMAPDQHIAVVPHVDEQRLTPPRENIEHVRVGIIGAANSVNRENICAFLRVAEKRFSQYFVPIEIVIAGSICRDLNDINLPFVTKIGYVDEVDEFYRSVDAVVVPMDFSTGLKIKVSEGLAFSKPLIAHAHAFEGFPATHDWHRLESMEAVVSACIDLAFDVSALPELANASLSSYQQLLHEYEAGIDSLPNALAGFAYDVDVVIDGSFLRKGSLKALALDDLLIYLSWACRVSVLFSGDPSAQEVELLRELSRKQSVILLNAQSRSAETSEFKQWSVNESDGSAKRLVLWTLVSPKTLPEQCLLGRHIIRDDRFLTTDPSFSKPDARAAVSVSAYSGSTIGVGDITHISLPFFSKTPEFFARSSHGAPVVYILCPHALSSGADILLAIIKHLEKLGYDAVLLTGAGNVVTTDIATKDLMQVYADMPAHLSIIGKIVDFTSEADTEFSALKEIACKRGIPVWRHGSKLIVHNGQTIRSPASLLALSKFLSDAAHPGRDQLKQERYNDDAGWASVWRLLKEAELERRISNQT